MDACYSPFFTSGFLSGTNKLASSSTSISGPRRGSLPTLKLHYSDHAQDGCSLEHVSYLSLDGAEAASAAVSATPYGHESVPAWLIPPSVDERGEPIRRKGVSPRQSRESLRVLPSPKIMPVSRLPVSQANAPASPSSLRRAYGPSDSDGTIATYSALQPASPARPRTISLSSADQSSSNRATFLASTLAKLEGLANHSFFDDDDDDDEDSDGSFVEPEDIVLPASPSNSHPRSSFFALSSNSANPSMARGVMNSWPLSSFVDLSGDSTPKEDDRWNWRSFIEIGVM